MKRMMMLGLLASAGCAFAQDEIEGPGEQPPSRSIGAQAVDGFGGVPGLSEQTAQVETAPAQPIAEATSQAPAQTVTEVVQGPSQPQIGRAPSTRPPRTKVDIKPPPAVIEAEVGAHYVFGIAVGHLNRVITPFADPVVKTTSRASIVPEKGIIYVSTDDTSQSIAMFVHERNDPETAVSLTLVPAGIPPVSTRLSLKGYAKAERYGVPRAVDAAQQFETGDDYVSTLSEIMQDLAHNRMPDGYGLMPVTGYPALMPECQWERVDVQPKQMLSGSAYTVFVALATNQGVREIPLDEAACGESHVRAVSTWPRSRLAPGEATEVYVIVSAEEDVAPEATRPSLLGAVR